MPAAVKRGIPALLLLATCAAFAPLSAGAQAADGSLDLEALHADRDQKARKYPLERRVSRYLTRAAEFVDEEKAGEAEALLERLTESRLDPYNLAYVYRMLGVVAYSDDRPAKAVEYFQKVLESVDGNKTRAAKILGIDRKTLRERLKKLGES